MTKLLILTYDFPPYVSVGGLRPYSWYKYLHLYDVYPIVVTRQWENKFGNNLDYISPGYSSSVEKQATSVGTIIKAPSNPHLGNKMLLKYGENKFKIVRRLITSYYEFLQFLFPIGNKQEIYSAADEYLKHNKVDCIIATGSPFVLFKYASQLSEKYSIPWIADYRDPWVQDKSVRSEVFRKWSAVFERMFIENAYRITTVSVFMQKQIEQNVKDKVFELLYNGYDPEIEKITNNINQCSTTLSIAFAGTIYDWHPIESFLRICNELLAENTDFKLNLNFYGINKEQKIREILTGKFQDLKPHVYFHSRKDNLELAKSIASQNACLLFNDYSLLGTKIYDYLALKRKIILCYENDNEANKLKEAYYCIDEIASESTKLQADVIRATDSGIVIKDSEHLKQVLQELNNELNENGFISCSSNGVERYSRIKQVERLARIVKKVSK